MLFTSIHISEVIDYLDSLLVCQQADNMKSLMCILHDAYVMHNSTDNERLHELLVSLQMIVEGFPRSCADAIVALCQELCTEKEQLAFSQGVRVGMLLMTEVNYLP